MNRSIWIQLPSTVDGFTLCWKNITRTFRTRFSDRIIALGTAFDIQVVTAFVTGHLKYLQIQTAWVNMQPVFCS
ncbi:hypothetical protein VI06_21640 [Aquitalea magnusonii]|nr:hypothetical protein VI06_21640 [Aquitalea magnusonii]